ncbi:hypothetical protein RND71_029443 [Anisodus tanguticus]|uniref:Uncharacterized protein n=1 Tax=Anisodus tanguticus TaxID=243964 RepID=A0AAE1REH2_9SOLA|nr:hypothetical protein RND71_029443 [Anisodus tanguticus]
MAMSSKIFLIFLVLIAIASVCVAQGRCGESCTVSYKGICRDHRSDPQCKAYCSERFGAVKVCEAKCIDEDDYIFCQCTLSIDACPQK